MEPDRAKVYAESVAMTNAALPTTVPVGRVAISLAAAPPRCAASLLAVFALVGTYRARYGSPDAWPGNPSAGDNAARARKSAPTGCALHSPPNRAPDSR